MGLREISEIYVTHETGTRGTPELNVRWRPRDIDDGDENDSDENDGDGDGVGDGNDSGPLRIRPMRSERLRRGAPGRVSRQAFLRPLALETMACADAPLSRSVSLRNGDSERRGAPQPRNDRDSLQRHLRPDSLRLGLGRHVPHHNLSPLRAHRVASRHLGTRCMSGPFGLRVVVRQRVRPSPPPHQEDQKPQVVLVFTGRPPEHQVSSLSLVFSLHIGFGSSDGKHI